MQLVPGDKRQCSSSPISNMSVPTSFENAPSLCLLSEFNESMTRNIVWIGEPVTIYYVIGPPITADYVIGLCMLLMTKSKRSQVEEHSRSDFPIKLSPHMCSKDLKARFFVLLYL